MKNTYIKSVLGDKPLNATSSTDREIVIARHRKMRKEYERWKTTSVL